MANGHISNSLSSRGFQPQSRSMSTTTTTKMEADKPEVHIIGLGNVSKLIAHSLMTSGPNPPAITMIFRDMSRFHDFAKAGHKITIARNDGEESVAVGFGSASVDKLKANHIRIQTLIVGTKAYDAMSAV